jgi:hypothetical protein
MNGFHSLTLAAMLLLATGCLVRQDDGPNGANPPPDDTARNLAATARSYYDTAVTAAFMGTSCRNCHKFIFEGGTAPLSIYEYDSMKPKLKKGSSPVANLLIAYVSGQTGHASSQDLCYGNLNNTPCQQIAIWYQKEFGNGTGAGLPPLGNVETISTAGLVKGWAQDIDEPAKAVRVEIYVNGPMGTGEFAGFANASEDYSGQDATGKVGFTFQLADKYRDRKPHDIYIYGVDTQVVSTTVQLRNSPQTNRSYIPSTAARNLYDSTVRAFIQANGGSSCKNCHGLSEFDFDNVFYPMLLSPVPPTGTATNNILYNKLRGSNHPGGNFCGGSPTTTPPCSDLIQVWNLDIQ